MSENFDSRTSVQIKLFEPIEVQGITYESLTMRRPKTRDTIMASKVKGTEAERGIRLLALLCDVADDVIMELDEVDATKLRDQYQNFTGRQSETD